MKDLRGLKKTRWLMTTSFKRVINLDYSNILRMLETVETLKSLLEKEWLENYRLVRALTDNDDSIRVLFKDCVIEYDLSTSYEFSGFKEFKGYQLKELKNLKNSLIERKEILSKPFEVCEKEYNKIEDLLC